MIDERQLLERAALHVAPPNRVMDGLVRRRNRKQRNRRIGSALLALVVAVGAFGFALHAFHRAVSPRPASPMITRENVADLKLAWTATLDAPPAMQPDRYAVPEPIGPVIADGVVYVATEHGTLEAFPESCTSPCAPIWKANVGAPIPFAPTVSGGYVYVAAGDANGGRIVAYRVGCASNGSTCESAWVGRISSQILSPPVVSKGLVLGLDLSQGELVAFSTACPSSQCSPAWTVDLGPPSHPTKKHGGFLPELVEPPVVADGVVYVKNFFDRSLHAIVERTGRELWHFTPTKYTSGVRYNWPVVEGGRVFYEGGGAIYAFQGPGCRFKCGNPLWRSAHLDGFLGQVAVSNDVVYTTLATNASSGGVAAFAADCRGDGGVCAPLWQGRVSGELTVAHVVVSDGLVFASSTLNQLTTAFPTICDDPCDPRWTTSATFPINSPVTPTTATGVAFVGGEGGVVALPADCSASCKPAWSYVLPGVYSSPTVDRGTAIVSTAGGKLLAFSVGSSRAPAASSHAGAAVFYGLLGLVGIGALSLRAYRRRHG